MRNYAFNMCIRPYELYKFYSHLNDLNFALNTNKMIIDRNANTIINLTTIRTNIAFYNSKKNVNKPK